MATTSNDEPRRITTAVVSVRVPNGADGDLATAAERRLERADGVSDVAVTELRDLEPGLSATVVTVGVAVVTTGGGGQAVLESLTELTGVETVPEHLD